MAGSGGQWRAVDKRAGELHQSYVPKARNTDRKYCATPEGVTGPVENKLASMGAVKGVVLGCLGEASQATHGLIYHLAVSRVRLAGPQRGRRGQFLEEQLERQWGNVRRAHALSVRQGRNILRSGQFMQL